MKIIGTIVNSNLTLIGLRVEGKAYEFGGFDDNMQVHDVQINELMQNKFKNSQLDCRNGRLSEVNNFKLKALPMRMWNPNTSTMVDINNNIKLYKRVLVNGKLEGFEASVGDIHGAFRTNNLIQLAGWFNTDNFVARFTDGKAFLAGKPGCSLDKLPAIERGNGAKSSKKAKVKTVQKAEPKHVHNPVVSKGFDIVTFYDIIDSFGGKIIFLPTEKYAKTKIAQTKTASNFVSFGAGEIGSPRINYTEKNLNVNMHFNKVGIVNVELLRGMQTFYPYTISSKTVFWNGVNNINKFAIAVQESDIPALQAKFANSLALEPYNNPIVTQPIKAFMGDTGNSVRFFLVDVSRFDIINKDNIKHYRLTNPELLKLALRLVQYKSYYAYANGVATRAKDAITAKGKVLPKPKYGPYAAMCDDDLLRLQEAGIDVFTGMFIGKEDTDEKSDMDAAIVRDAIATGHVPSIKEDIEIEFQVKGMASAMKYKDCKSKKETALVKNDIKFAETLFKLVDTFEGMQDINKMYIEAEKVKSKLDNTKRDIIKKLWYHKMACLVDGNYASFKVENINDWDAGKAIKNGITYTCNQAGAEGLVMKVSNINLA